MVLAAKIFLVKEDMDIDTVAVKLKGVRQEEERDFDGKVISLASEVHDLTVRGDSLEGIFSYDDVLMIRHRGQISPTPRTVSATFLFSKIGKKILLSVLEKKQRANNVANLISRILFITVGKIVEARIPPEILRRFHEENIDDTKIIFFDDVDIPNISKLSLYGSALGNSTLYSDYLTHGNIWYTVVKSRAYGYIVGVTRNSVVTVFSKIETPDFIHYLENEIFPLIP